MKKDFVLLCCWSVTCESCFPLCPILFDTASCFDAIKETVFRAFVVSENITFVVLSALPVIRIYLLAPNVAFGRAMYIC